MNTTVVRAYGGSMGPFIPSGSRLEVERVCAELLQCGDVVCFINDEGFGVAHRVVDVVSVNGRMHFNVRGDVQQESEIVPVEAIVYKVRSVSYRGLSYHTTDRVGRMLADIAMSRTSSTGLAKKGVCAAWDLLQAGYRWFKERRSS